MATTASLSSNMSGVWSRDYYTRALEALNTPQNITTFNNITKQLNLPNLSLTGGLVAETCNFTPTGAITAADRVLTLKGLGRDHEICFKDMRALWDALEASGSFQNADAPAVFQAALIDLLLREIGWEVEQQIWQGDGTTNEILGFIPAWLADVNVIDVSTPLVLTKGNIVAEVERALGDAPQAVLNGAQKPRIYMNPNTARIFGFSQQALGYLDKFNADNPIPFTFAGEFEIASCNGMPNNTFVIAKPDNLYFGTGDTGDIDDIRIVDMRESTADRKLRISALMGIGVQYRLGNEITLYHLAGS